MTILDIIIQGTDDASDELNNVDSSLSKLGSSAGGAVKAGMAVASTAIVAVGAAAIGAGVAAVNLSTDISGATNDIAAQLGVSQEAAAGFEGVMKDIYANNFGDSFDDIGAAITTVVQNMGDLAESDAVMQGLVEDAFALRDAFGTEVEESVMAASNLMNEFGLSGEEAMDLVASGMQNGLNNSGDFIDSISEYGNLFADAGFSADQMYSIMATGAETGVLGVDKIADAVKEMGIKLNEGGKDTSAAFDTIGMSFDTISASVAAGDETWADYFDDIVGGINSIEDPIERQKAQVAIFGTMAEDLGDQFTFGLSAASASLEGMSGATEALNAQYDNWPSMWEGVKRNALLALEPLGDALLGIGNEIMPVIEEGFQWLSDNVGPIIEQVAEVITTFMANLEEGMTPLDAFIAAIEGLVPPEVVETITVLATHIGTFIEQVQKAMEPVIAFIAENVKLKDILIAAALVIGGVILSALASLIVAIAPVLLAIAGLVAIVATLRRAWEEDFAGIRDFVADIWDAIMQAFDAFKSLFAGDFDGFLEGIKGAWSTAWNAIAEFMGNIWSMVQPKLAALWASFVQWFNDTDWNALALQLMITLANGLDAFWDWVSPKLAALWDSFVTWFNDTDWTALAITLMEGIAEWLSNFWDYVSPKLESLWTSIEGWFDGINWYELAERITDGIADGLGDIWDGIEGFFDDMWGRASSWFDSIDWWELGAALIDGIIDGIKDGVPRIIEAAKAAAQAALNAALEKLGIKSPSTVARDEIGKPFSQGIAWGILDDMGVIGDAARDAVEPLTDPSLGDIPAGVAHDEVGFPWAANIAIGIVDGAGVIMEAINDIAKYLNNQKIGRFAQSAIKVFELVGATITGIKVLSDVNFPEIVKGWHLAEQMIIFQKIVKNIMNQFHVLSGEFDTEYSKQMQEYVEAADDLFSLVEIAIEASTMLSDVDFAPIVGGKDQKPFHLRDQMILFRKIVNTMVTQFEISAAEMSSDRLKAIQDFARAGHDLFEMVEVAITGMRLLTEIDFMPIIRGKEDKPFHLRNQMELFRKIINTLVVQFGIISDQLGPDKVSDIAKLAGSINKFIEDTTDIIDGIFDMIDVLNDLVNAEIPGGLADILAQMAAVLKSHITPMQDIGTQLGNAFIAGLRGAITAGLITINDLLASLSGGGGFNGAGLAVAGGLSAGTGGGLSGMTTNVNMGGLTFNTTVSNQMTEDEFHFRVVESVRRMVTA